MESQELVGLRAFLVSTGKVPTGSYNAAPAEWSGTIFDFTTRDGRRLWLVTVETTALSNDHFAYRELLLEPTGRDPNTWSLIDARGWQFDRAGIEGIEWYVMAVGLGIVAGIPVLTLYPSTPSSPTPSSTAARALSASTPS